MSKTGYMCGTDFHDEIGMMTTVVYPTIESLKRKATCWTRCGIVKVSVEMIEEIEPSTWGEVGLQFRPKEKVND